MGRRSAISALLGRLRVTRNVSFDSFRASPTTWTVKVWLVTVGAKVSIVAPTAA